MGAAGRPARRYGAFTAQMLTVDGDRLLVLGRPYAESGAPRTDEILAFVWERGTWNEFPMHVPVGALTRGGELDAGYFADGTPVFLSRRGGVWYQSDDGFDYIPAATERWPTSCCASTPSRCGRPTRGSSCQPPPSPR